jgi:putative restriction endonuclease
MDEILRQVTSLRRAKTLFGPAPHKPVLLLAVLESFENQEIEQNHIGLSESLLTRYYDLWQLLVKSDDVPNFAKPFYNLSNERRGLWKLIVIPGRSIPDTINRTFKYLNTLKGIFTGAQLSDEFYDFVTNHEKRDQMRQILLDTYFPGHSVRKIETGRRLSKIIETQILYEQPENYAQKAIIQIGKNSDETQQEVKILRGHLFRKVVLVVYNEQCAISGLKIKSSEQTGLIDACHIIPFSQTFDDTIGNGIALSPTMHRAFDSGLIAIDDDYKIMVHPNLTDCHPVVRLRELEHQTILLPKSEKFYPSLERLAEHRLRFGFVS